MDVPEPTYPRIEHHGGADGIPGWPDTPREIRLVHGEAGAREALRERLNREAGCTDSNMAD